MTWTTAFGKRFGGFWNSAFLILVLIICVRFAGAEWKAQALGVRLLYALYLTLGVVGVGLLVAAVRAGMIKLSQPPPHEGTEGTVAGYLVGGLKYGMVAGTVVLFVAGLLLVDDFLGPLKQLFDLIIDKIAKRIP